MYTYVSDTGDVYVEAIDRDDNIYSTHPVSNHKITVRITLKRGYVNISMGISNIRW